MLTISLALNWEKVSVQKAHLQVEKCPGIAKNRQQWYGKHGETVPTKKVEMACYWYVVLIPKSSSWSCVLI